MLDSEELNARLFFPTKLTSPKPEGAIDVFVDVEGARLHTRRHRVPDARATVLFFHGNGEVVADYDEVAPSYRELGLELAVVDYRGYGASTGTPSLRHAIEDAHPVLDAIVAQGTKKLVVMGRSLGSSAAAELYGSGRAEIAGVIIESGFFDLFALIRRRELTPPKSLSEEEQGVFDPLPKLRRGTLPLLVLHGARDTLIVPEEGRALFDAANTSQKELVTIANRGHNDVSFSQDYWRAIDRFTKSF